MFGKFAAWIVIVAVLVCHSALAADKPAESTDKGDKPAATPPTAVATSSTNDYGIPQNLMQMITNGGAVAVGIAVVAAVVALAMPMFGFRYCQLMGNCETPYAYSNGNAVYQNDAYAQYPQASYPSGNTYQKRSLDYVGPVLHLLKTAYDKYGQQNSLAASSKKAS